jgi:hypothetical protein
MAAIATGKMNSITSSEPDPPSGAIPKILSIKSMSPPSGACAELDCDCDQYRRWILSSAPSPRCPAVNAILTGVTR